jgi:hypothetical protein
MLVYQWSFLWSNVFFRDIFNVLIFYFHPRQPFRRSWYDVIRSISPTWSDHRSPQLLYYTIQYSYSHRMLQVYFRHLTFDSLTIYPFLLFLQKFHRIVLFFSNNKQFDDILKCTPIPCVRSEFFFPWNRTSFSLKLL